MLTGTHEIPLREIDLSRAAARSFSQEAKEVLKKKILDEGEDMGGQLPIVVASGKHSDLARFDPQKVNTFT